MLVIDQNIHLLPWSRETGPSINVPPATNYTATNVPLGSGKALLVTNYSTQANGADLVTCKRPLYAGLTGVTLPYLRLRCKMFISSIDMLNLGRLETDTKVCLQSAPNSSTPIANVANGSTQLNRSTGFWQIDGDPPGWKNTAFKPVLPADQWFDYYHDLYMNQPGPTGIASFTVRGVGFGAQRYQTAAPDPQNVPLQTTNWQQVCAVQLQLMVLKAGTVNVAYDQMDLVWSDQPIS